MRSTVLRDLAMLRAGDRGAVAVEPPCFGVALHTPLHLWQASLPASWEMNAWHGQWAAMHPQPGLVALWERAVAAAPPPPPLPPPATALPPATAPPRRSPPALPSLRTELARELLWQPPTAPPRRVVPPVQQQQQPQQPPVHAPDAQVAKELASCPEPGPRRAPAPPPETAPAPPLATAPPPRRKPRRRRNKSCPTCGLTFDHRGDLNRHMRTHSGERPYACVVDGCPKRFSSSSNRWRHVRTQHPGAADVPNNRRPPARGDAEHQHAE